MPNTERKGGIHLERIPGPGSRPGRGPVLVRGSAPRAPTGGSNVVPKNQDIAYYRSLKAQHKVWNGGFELRDELKMVGKVGQVAMLAQSAYDVASSAHEDYKQSTTRNTITTAAAVGAGVVGGDVAGTAVGAVVGSFLGPGGTFFGGLIGGAIGGYLSASVATSVVDAVGDSLEYNMEVRSCDVCYRQFMARAYLGERRCRDCSGQ